MHWNKCRKINIEMRFHKNFIENGRVFVEILQKDSPLTPDKAALLLTLIQQECDAQDKILSDMTVLQRVFLKLPEFVELMRIFTSSIDVPNAAHKTENSSLAGSFCDDASHAQMFSNESTDVLGNINSMINKTLSMIPVTYVPSPFE